MSIWCSLDEIGWEVDGWLDERGQPIVPERHGGEVRSYANGWSNHYPTTDGSVEQQASICLATIPAWCAGGSHDDFEAVGPWIRLDVHTLEHNYFHPDDVKQMIESNASVVMDEGAVRLLVEQLTEWLARPKTSPPAGAA